MVESVGDTFESTFSSREILLLCVFSALAICSWVKPAAIRSPISFLRNT